MRLLTIIVVFCCLTISSISRYICHLSATNVLYILLFAFSPLLDNAALVDPAVCKVTKYLLHVCHNASLYTLVALSVERFYDARYPLRDNTNPRVIQVVLFSVWFHAAVVSFGKYFLPPVCFTCTTNGPSVRLEVLKANFSFFDLLLSYAIPVSFIAFFFVMTIRELVLSVKSATHLSERILNAKTKIIWAILGLLVTYAVFSLPFHTMSLYIYFKPDLSRSLARRLLIVNDLSVVYPCSNPIILYSMSSQCRRHINYYLFRLVQRDVDHPDGEDVHVINLIGGTPALHGSSERTMSVVSTAV